jgi:two-component system response regulator MprA
MLSYVLIVEDDLDIREMLQSLLRDEGYEVAIAGNGQEALQQMTALGARRPSLILLDLMMPVMDGHAFLDAIQARFEFKNIPVLMLTAAQTTRRSEVAGYLKKPLDLSELLGAVERLAKSS